MNHKLIRNGFILAAVMNFSVIIFSRGFTNVVINNADPVVMSNFGLIMIAMWGLAYLAGSTAISNIKWLSGVFALEKLIYGVVWIRWLSENSLDAVYSADILSGVFYSIYGLNDFLFMVFFVCVFFSSGQENNTHQQLQK